MYHSNVQKVVSDKGKTRVSNSYQKHATRGEAFTRVFNALKGSRNPKGSVYYHNRMYTVGIS